MKKIVIIAAMSKEIALIKSMLGAVRVEKTAAAEFFYGAVGEKEILLIKSGIGKVCATAAAVEAINRFHPDAVINTGAAGGLVPTVAVMDVVAASTTAYYDVFCGGEWGQVQDFPKYFDADASLYQKALALGITGGVIASGDKFVTSGAEVAEIKKVCPDAVAVDMESAALAQVCYMYRVPFLSLRVISDTPGVANHAAQYENFWETAGEESFKVLQKLLHPDAGSRKVSR